MSDPRERRDDASDRATDPTRDRSGGADDDDDALRSAPLLRPTALFMAPPSPAPAAASGPRPSAQLEEAQAIATALLERAAFGGDGQRGVARLRFGGAARGGLAGGTVTLVAEAGRVSVRFDGVDDADAEALTARLRRRGIAVDEG